MAGFYIKQICAKGNQKRDAILEFDPKLNIIIGPSDSGKSCILKCMEFVFGGNYQKLKTPFKESSGYDTAGVTLSTELYGDITFTRRVRSTQVEVRADSPAIENGLYAITKPSKNAKNPKPVLNTVMMKLLGIEREPEVPGNARFEKKRMTWENLLRLYYIKETRIDNPDPLFEPTETYKKTLFLSSLLFLLKGHDFSEQDAQTKSEIKKARKEAVHEYVNKKIQEAHERQIELERQVNNIENTNVEEKLLELEKLLQDTESAISSAVEDSQKLLSDIVVQEAKAAECDLLLSRYAHLRSQYKADIQRLTFIVEGEQNVSQMPEISVCPFCNGKIATQEKSSYIKAARGELSRIISQLSGLSASEKDLIQEQRTIESTLEALNKHRSDIEQFIQYDLKPRSFHIRESIENYNCYIQLKNEMSLLKQYADIWEGDLTAYDVSQRDISKNALQYHPKEYFDSSFQTELSDDMNSILNECHYRDFTSARFDMETFDIEVNGEPKEVHGKGYHSYLNTVVALAFRNYFHNHAKYNADILIIDTPLHGFEENESCATDATNYSMRTGLFSYFANHLTGQLIIVENKDHIPDDMDLSALGAKVIQFTKDRNVGRYGFLYDVY